MYIYIYFVARILVGALFYKKLKNLIPQYLYIYENDFVLINKII